MSDVVVRVLAISYLEQEAWVRWGRTSCSSTFGIANGISQGSVASPAILCIYLDPLSDNGRGQESDATWQAISLESWATQRTFCC